MDADSKRKTKIPKIFRSSCSLAIIAMLRQKRSLALTESEDDAKKACVAWVEERKKSGNLPFKWRITRIAKFMLLVRDFLFKIAGCCFFVSLRGFLLTLFRSVVTAACLWSLGLGQAAPIRDRAGIRGSVGARVLPLRSGRFALGVPLAGQSRRLLFAVLLFCCCLSLSLHVCERV